MSLSVIITPLIIISLLTLPVIVLKGGATVFKWPFDRRKASAIGLGLAFIFAAIGHFVKTEPMVQMLPAWIPGREGIVYATGLLELFIASALLMPAYRRVGAIVAIVVLIVFFPANIYAALNHVGMGGLYWGRNIC